MTKGKARDRAEISLTRVLSDFFADPDEGLLNKLLGQGKAKAVLYALEHGEDLFQDPLTGAYDRRLLEDLWLKETMRSQRHGHAFAGILLDLDGLKEINDRRGYQGKHGYEAGDRALQNLASTILSEVREGVDSVIRYGGDEFLIFLPETNIIGARHFMDRLAEVLPKDLGVSFGVAEWEGGSFYKFLEQVNKELHQQKKTKGVGR